MTRILILRPEPAAGRTAEKAAALGLEVRRHPLFAPQPVDWSPPTPDRFDALLLTSANGVRLAGPDLERYRALPAYAVGQATARVLEAAGFSTVIAGTSDGSEIAARIAADGHRRVLHLAGTTVAPMETGAVDVMRIAVYSMATLPPDPALIADATPGTVLLVHSPRAGERLAERIEATDRAALYIVAISPSALAACGVGWASGQAAALPDDDEMLALAARLCE
ncbi:uroporphyrinogen-III synthase [Sphingobium sp. CR2-8]|uniref:uroporphyrinogen-III synthase n=1 Tax=Sphingobium sp. CR2-8 TaxID=1306534 RepID=UPI002DBF0E69|nr:uroporphyrinogen-III synthase [Sphingobium sp. CR2-8]MEC3912688.1 uroporphyrinogen-III synthase [Sphingobium sp. CR2-8]